jgi:hypothetical protein
VGQNDSTIVKIEGTGGNRAVYVQSGADAVFENVTITGGKAENGGGIYIGNNAILTLKKDVVVKENSAEKGSGIYIEKDGKLILAESVRVDGDIYLFDGDTITVAGKLTGYGRITLDNFKNEKRRVLMGTTGGGNNDLFRIANPTGVAGMMYFVDAEGYVDGGKLVPGNPDDPIIGAPVAPGGPSDAISVTVSPETLSLRHLGTSKALTAAISPDTANQGVVWSTSDSSVATVDEKGVVTAVGSGTAVITATSEAAPGTSATCAVEVLDSVET